MIYLIKAISLNILQDAPCEQQQHIALIGFVMRYVVNPSR